MNLTKELQQLNSSINGLKNPFVVENGQEEIKEVEESLENGYAAADEDYAAMENGHTAIENGHAGEKNEVDDSDLVNIPYNIENSLNRLKFVRGQG